MALTGRLQMLSVMTILGLALLGCGSHEPGGGQGVDWDSFQPLSGPGIRTTSLEELQQAAGFELVLPSYLPEGMRNTFVLSTHVDPSLWPDHQAHISLLPQPGSGAPGIGIEEDLRDPSEAEPEYASSFEVARIGNTDVGCSIEILGPGMAVGGATLSAGEPTRDPKQYPILVCEWVGEELSFRLLFSWESLEPVPGQIAPERREEAMKIIASMIENPYIP
jgi:hypothetical protein